MSTLNVSFEPTTHTPCLINVTNTWYIRLIWRSKSSLTLHVYSNYNPTHEYMCVASAFSTTPAYQVDHVIMSRLMTSHYTGHAHVRAYRGWPCMTCIRLPRRRIRPKQSKGINVTRSPRLSSSCHSTMLAKILLSCLDQGRLRISSNRDSSRRLSLDAPRLVQAAAGRCSVFKRRSS